MCRGTCGSWSSRDPVFLQKNNEKTKSGYSTDVDVLEKLRNEHPVIERLLEYRQLAKLSSTYVEGLKPYINPKTKRIHSFFHQTITATG